MLAPSTPFWGLPCGVTRYWRLCISRNFKRPKYYIGQTVTFWSKTPLPEQKTLPHRVVVVGIVWSSNRWEYLFEIPDDHPWSDDDGTLIFATESEITPW